MQVITNSDTRCTICSVASFGGEIFESGTVRLWQNVPLVLDALDGPAAGRGPLVGQWLVSPEIRRPWSSAWMVLNGRRVYWAWPNGVESVVSAADGSTSGTWW